MLTPCFAAEAEFNKHSEILPAKYHKAELAKCVPLHLAKHKQEELLTDAQTQYTVIEQELLSIVEMLHEFQTILLGHEIIIYMDHKNHNSVVWPSKTPFLIVRFAGS